MALRFLRFEGRATFHGMGGEVFVVGFLVLVVVLVVLGVLAERKRREALRRLAGRLGFRFRQERDRGLASECAFLDRLRRGSNRYAFNIMEGEYRGSPVLVFDYHYETHSTDSKGRSRTHHHYLCCYLMRLPKRFPELTVAREGLLSKIAQAFGYDDIDFESHEFSRKFCVRSKDKRFAYDFCHARMMEYLLANPDLSVEVEGNALAFVFSGRLKPGTVEGNLQRLAEVRALMPEYLFE